MTPKERLAQRAIFELCGYIEGVLSTMDEDTVSVSIAHIRFINSRLKMVADMNSEEVPK